MRDQNPGPPGAHGNRRFSSSKKFSSMVTCTEPFSPGAVPGSASTAKRLPSGARSTQSGSAETRCGREVSRSIGTTRAASDPEKKLPTKKKRDGEAGKIAETTINKGCGELQGLYSSQSHPQIPRTGQIYMYLKLAGVNVGTLDLYQFREQHCDRGANRHYGGMPDQHVHQLEIGAVQLQHRNPAEAR